MLRATLRSLMARKLRLLLASFAVLLGVSFVSGAFVLTDSLSRVFDSLFSAVNVGTAVNVESKAALGESAFDGDQREPIPQSVADRVAKVDGVAGSLVHTQGLATLVLPNGKAYRKNGPPVIAVGFDPDNPLSTLEVKRGAAPHGVTQMAIDTATATKEHLRVGDHVAVLGRERRQAVTIVGLIGFKGAGTPAGATLLAFDLRTAQGLVGYPGMWQRVSLSAKPGVSPEVLAKRVSAVLPPKVEAITVKQTVADQSKGLKQGLGYFNTVLLAFAAISLFVGAFLIFNTFSMLIAQRTRELALMRALGASRRQVTRSVLIEALVVGTISSLGGFGLGILVALGLRSLLGALGIDLPGGDTVVALRTFVASMVVGIGVTTAAALVPARRAAKVSPVQAMRESTPAEERSLVRRALIGTVLVVVAVAALAGGLNQGSLQLVGAGAALAFIGVTVLSPLIARPVVGLLGWPLSRRGVPGRLGRGNAMRNPRRTSATAAALMIGLALVAMVNTLAASLRDSVEQTVASSLGADYVLDSGGETTFPPGVASALRGHRELAAVAAITFGVARIGDSRSPVQGIDPTALRQVLHLKVLSGDLANLDRGDLAVSKKEAKSLHVSVGDQVPVTWARTGSQPMRVGAVFDDNPFAGGYLVGPATFARNVTNDQLSVVAVKAAPGVAPARSRSVIEQALTPYPNVEIQDQAQFVKREGDQISTLLNALYALLGLSVLIAVLGIVNTLALSVIERTRELGLLRAVGLQRRQLRRMIRTESVLIAVYGALLGIVIGLAFGWALVQSLHDQGVTVFTVPYVRMLVVLLVAALAGVVAAALPARRAARLNVLEAVATD